jgi:hypothetical protein
MRLGLVRSLVSQRMISYRRIFSTKEWYRQESKTELGGGKNGKGGIESMFQQ